MHRDKDRLKGSVVSTSPHMQTASEDRRLTDLPSVALRETDFRSVQTKRKMVQQSGPPPSPPAPRVEEVMSCSNELPITGKT